MYETDAAEIQLRDGGFSSFAILATFFKASNFTVKYSIYPKIYQSLRLFRIK